MTREEAVALLAQISEEVPHVNVTLDLDQLAKHGGLGEIWRLIVDWPQHMKVVIRDAEQWDRRREWFEVKEETLD